MTRENPRNYPGYHAAKAPPLNTGTNDLTADLKGEIEGFKCMPVVLVRLPSLYSQSPRPHILTIPDISLDPPSTLYIPESRDHMPLQGGSWSSLKYSPKHTIFVQEGSDGRPKGCKAYGLLKCHE